MRIGLITQEDVPRWYGLSWNREERSISVSVDADTLRGIQDVPEDSPIVRGLRKIFLFNEFVASFSANFGFNQALNRVEEAGDVKFVAKLPQVFELLNKKCGVCRGKGTRSGSKCYNCGGVGMEHNYDFTHAYAISASLNLLFQLLQYPERKSASKRPQLMTLRLSTFQDMHGGSLGGMYSIPVVNWLSGMARRDIPEMISALKLAHEHMMGKEMSWGPFEAWVTGVNGWLNVSSPGNACGLNPSSGALLGKGYGYDFSCHNVDSPAQQLTLLAGLAALHECVDKSLT